MKKALEIKWKIYKNRDLERPYFYDKDLGHLTIDSVQGGEKLMRGYVAVFSTGYVFTYNASKGFSERKIDFGIKEAQKLSGKDFGELLQENVSKKLEATIKFIVNKADTGKIKNIEKYKHQLKI